MSKILYNIYNIIKIPSSQHVIFFLLYRQIYRSPFFDLLFPKTTVSCDRFAKLILGSLGCVYDYVELILGSLGCVYDYVEVFGGGRPNAPSLGKFCGSVKPASLRSSTNELLLKFFSDQSITRSGFVATYTAEPQGRYSSQAFFK